MQIITDCAADLPVEEARDLSVVVAPLFIQFPEGEVSAADITPDEFYDRLERMQPRLPTTAQPSAGLFAEIYRGLAARGEQLLSIHISGGLSGTVNAARVGAEQLAGQMVRVVDSLTLSGGERFQVLAAARAARAGWSLERLLERLEAIRQATEVIYTLDTLTYLARGGRIGRVQALAGALLNLKPIIRVDHADGKYSTVEKARTIRRALDGIADHLAKMYAGQGPLWVSIPHGRFAEQAEALKEILRQRLEIGRMEVLRISPVLGVHTGPGIVGAAVVPQRLIDEIA